MIKKNREIVVVVERDIWIFLENIFNWLETAKRLTYYTFRVLSRLHLAQMMSDERNAMRIQPHHFFDMIRSSTSVEKVIPVDQFNLYGRLDRCEMTSVVSSRFLE